MSLTPSRSRVKEIIFFDIENPEVMGVDFQKSLSHGSRLSGQPEA